MKANLSLSKSITDDAWYLVINDTYYHTITEEEFYELAEFLKIKLCGETI